MTPLLLDGALLIVLGVLARQLIVLAGSMEALINAVERIAVAFETRNEDDA